MTTEKSFICISTSSRRLPTPPTLKPCICIPIYSFGPFLHMVLSPAADKTLELKKIIKMIVLHVLGAN